MGVGLDLKSRKTVEKFLSVTDPLYVIVNFWNNKRKALK